MNLQDFPKTHAISIDSELVFICLLELMEKEQPSFSIAP